ncbi:MAG: WYL domain-containing protein [Lachnospiraceae bacterium]|nr:WYL domain-containing protein [Lachnospiraceae bacterium]
MKLFTEIYNCYFQIVDEICKTAQAAPITQKEMISLAARFGFKESAFLIVPRMINNWNLLEKVPEGYLSKIDNLEVLPLTILQKRWLKSILMDKRIGLFLDTSQLKILHTYLDKTEPLFEPDDFYEYDRFSDGDDFSCPQYISHFRTLLKAIHQRQYVQIHFYSHKDRPISIVCLPCRLEYSAKNDKFRLLAISKKSSGLRQVETINLSRIHRLTLIEQYCEKKISLEDALKNTYYKEPVRLLITTSRNTLERTMLHFANYEKQTKKLDDHHYECLIYYNRMVETELLIEILSFGPTVQVLGPESFLAKIKERIQKQLQLIAQNET